MKVNWTKLKYKLLVIVSPTYWMRTGKINKQWDKELWDAIECGLLSHVGQYMVVADGSLVWIQNHPYASGTKYSDGPVNDEMMSSRATTMFLFSRLRETRILDRLKGITTDSAFEKHSGLMP